MRTHGLLSNSSCHAGIDHYFFSILHNLTKDPPSMWWKKVRKQQMNTTRETFLSSYRIRKYLMLSCVLHKKYRKLAAKHMMFSLFDILFFIDCSWYETTWGTGYSAHCPSHPNASPPHPNSHRSAPPRRMNKPWKIRI